MVQHYEILYFRRLGIICQHFIVLSFREHRNTAMSDTALAKVNAGNIKSIQKAER